MDADDKPDSHQNLIITFWPFTMFLEICMQIHSVVFGLGRQINKQKVCENDWCPLRRQQSFCKISSSRGLSPYPLRTPLTRRHLGHGFQNNFHICSSFCQFNKKVLIRLSEQYSLNTVESTIIWTIWNNTKSFLGNSLPATTSYFLVRMIKPDL